VLNDKKKMAEIEEKSKAWIQQGMKDDAAKKK